MAIDWTKVGNDVVAAVSNVVGTAWSTVKPAAYAQMASLVEAGREIEAERANMTKDEYDGLCLSQKRAMEGVLACYQAISIVVAEQAAAAAWNVIAGALKAAYGLPFLP